MKAIITTALLSILSVWVYANNTHSTATDLGILKGSITISTSGSLDTAEDVDWYKVTITSPGVLIGDIPSNTNATGLAMHMYIYSANNVTGAINEHEPSAIGARVYTETIVSPGTYYILVEPRQWWFTPNNNTYRLQVSIDTTDIHELNNTHTNAYPISANDTINAKIRGYNQENISFNEGYDWDWYELTTNKDGILTVDIPSNNNATALRLTASIYDAVNINTAIASDRASVTGGRAKVDAYLPAGSYYILVHSKNWWEVDSNFYQMIVQLDTNNGFVTAEAKKLCDTVAGYTRVSNDTDYYSISNIKPNSVAQVYQVNSNISIEVNAFDNNQQNIASQTGALGQDVKLTLPSNTAYVSIAENNASSVVSNYRFALTEPQCLTSVNNSVLIHEFTISPNPSNGKFLIRLNGNKNDDAIMTITDVMGRVIKELPIRSGKDNYIELNEPSGLYIVTVQSESYKLTKKLMIN